MSTTLYYASDIHGSDVLWRKFVNAGKFYEAQVLVMGGDITGKGVVPIVDTGHGFERRGGDGQGAFSTTPRCRRSRSGCATSASTPTASPRPTSRRSTPSDEAVDEVFSQVMRDSLARWMALAEERLAGTGISLFVMIGNDDDVSLRDVLAASPAVIDPEDVVVDIGEGFSMYSCGWANPTPWNTPREMPDDEFERHLEAHLEGLGDPSRAIFNFHAPPYGTALDQAPQLDDTLKPVVSGGTITMTSVGSKAVRAVIERHQPALTLHGHIHESRGIARLGRTICINTGSEYAEGVLHGAIVTIDKKKGVQQHVLASG